MPKIKFHEKNGDVTPLKDRTRSKMAGNITKNDTKSTKKQGADLISLMPKLKVQLEVHLAI